MVKELEILLIELKYEDRLLDIRREYTRLFISAPSALPCPPYESVYLGGKREIMKEETHYILKIMDRWGLKLKRDLVDLPEHVAAELSILAFLLDKVEALNEERAKEDLVELLRRMNSWVPKLRECIEAEGKERIYITLLKAIEVALQVERARWRALDDKA